MSALTVIASSARFDFVRHLRSPAIWIAALAAPIAAAFIIPPIGADYSAVTVNTAKPIMTSATLGLILGIVTAVVLAPAAFIFLRAGPTRHRPWQVTDVAPYSRPAAAFGRWLADVGALWLILAALTLAGIVLAPFRVETGGVNIFQLVATLWITAAPALALVATVRAILDSRGITRKWPGEVIFFMVWLACLIVALAPTDFSGSAASPNPMQDPFGFLTPILNGTSEAITALTIGSSPGLSGTIGIDALSGVLDQDYLISRIVWMSIAVFGAFAAGIIYGPHRSSKRGAKLVGTPQPNSTGGMQTGLSDTISTPLAAAKRSLAPWLTIIVSEIQTLLNSRKMLLVFLVVGAAGAFLPYRTVAGPAIWLALLFPMTAEAGRWQSRNLRGLLTTTGSSTVLRMACLVIGGALVFAAAHLPAAARALAYGTPEDIISMAVISLAVPAVATMLGAVTRNAVTGRLILLMAWYAWLSSPSIA